MENRGYFSAYPLLKAVQENVKNTLRILDMESYHQEGLAEFGLNFTDIKKFHLLPVRFDRLLFGLLMTSDPKILHFMVLPLELLFWRWRWPTEELY